MAKIGLTSEVVFAVNDVHNAVKKIEINEAVIKKENAYSNLYNKLKSVNETKDIRTIMNIEKVIIHMESEFYSERNVEFGKSMAVAKEDINNALNCLSLHKNSKEYMKNSVAIPKQKNGLPYDTFRQFIDSNKARLNNRGRTAELSGEEKKVISARIRNMDIADKEYQKLQMKSLGMEMKGKDKGLER